MRTWLQGAYLLMMVAIYPAQEIQTPVAVPAEEEPHHHLVLKNEYVMVLRVKLPAGERTGYHIHSRDNVALRLADVEVTDQVPGQPEGPLERQKQGYISLRTLRGITLTHRVNNVGRGEYDVLDVELLQRPEHAAGEAAAPVAAENPSARVYNWKLGPGEASPMHAHGRPYLIVAVTDMKLKMIGPDGQTSEHEIKAGDIHWVDGRVTHSLANAGAVAGQITEIEMK